jgi:EAL domain-containing protein (putative c-di-GMP-specific phosphodiesterase class I)
MLQIFDRDALHAERPNPGLPADRRAEALLRRRLRRELTLAVRREMLTLHYQPRVCLATGALLGAEALARWPQRRGGAMPASRFLPLAEEAGLMAQIGAWALTRACATAAGWPGQAVVSVNIAAAQMRGNLLPEQVAAALVSSGLAPERLELELGEALLAEQAPAHTGADGAALDLLLNLAAIRDLGVGLAVANFGTGLASLSMLRRLPLTSIKLDRLMVRDAAEQAEDAALLHALVQAGHALGLTVVAEGVETEAQRTLLAGIGCDAAQGYLFGAPMPGERLATRLACAELG